MSPVFRVIIMSSYKIEASFTDETLHQCAGVIMTADMTDQL